ncbi:MAG TPA: glycosyltransferase family 2 protein [Syntrophorhabdaceae bacterium]|nr:glycosyltransferase family 2 protein [Syntrophorhabdaceae bacterium]
MIALAFWFIGIFLMWDIRPVRKQHDRLTLAPAYRSRVSVIIPARNEEQNIRKLLQSLQEQTHEPYEIIVVDDQSEDKTASVAAEFNVTVTSGSMSKDTWVGKSWACFQGAEQSRGDTLLFLDADTCLARTGLSDLEAIYAEQKGLVTVQPYHAMVRTYEQFSAFFNIIVMAGLNVFTPFGDKLRPGGGFGPCVICSRQDYFSTGGHHAVKGKVLEDIALAKTFLAAGKKVSCYSGRGTISFRMYPDGFRSLLEGWTKGFAEGSTSIHAPILLMIVFWIIGCFEAFTGIIKLISAQHAFFISPLIVYGLYVLQLRWILRRIGTFNMWTAVLFPLPLTFFVVLMMWSIVQKHVLKKVRWKGRIIQLNDRR